MSSVACSSYLLTPLIVPVRPLVEKSTLPQTGLEEIGFDSDLALHSFPYENFS